MNRIRKFFVIAGAVLLIVALLATGFVMAKYVRERKKDIPITAKNFYFESNYLTSYCPEYKLNADTTNVSIKLYNFENELRISEVDCTYEVKVESDEDSNYESFTLDYKNATAQTQTISIITLNNLKSGCSYTVTATAKGGYEKSLSAKFTVAAVADGFYMNVTETDEYVVLTLWTEEVKGEVTVNVPKGLIPDATDEILAQCKNYKNNQYVEFNFTDTSSFISTYASRAYRFFKTDQSGSGSFSAKIGDKSATLANIP